MRRKKVVALGFAVLMSTAVPAYAGHGFLAETFVRPFSPSAADQLDEEHAKMGKPLDHAANAGAGIAADAIVPGSGPVVTGVLEARTATK
jgi:hypothetical protein